MCEVDSLSLLPKGTTRPESAFGEIKMATSTLKTSTLHREFVFNGSRIPDPDAQMSVEQVRDLLTPLLLLQSHRFERLKPWPWSETTREELVAIFAMKATAPPPEANKLLVRH